MANTNMEQMKKLIEAQKNQTQKQKQQKNSKKQQRKKVRKLEPLIAHKIRQMALVAKDSKIQNDPVH